jgi:cyclopropane-fatty-acyl-phospholipid synthase
MLFGMLLRRLIHVGSIRLINTNGQEQIFGNGEEPRCTLRLHDKSLGTTLAFHPSLSIGEAFMDGGLTIEEGDLFDLLEIFARNLDDLEVNPVFSFIGRVRHQLAMSISGDRAKSNVAHHYGLSGELYKLFLDSDDQYSCAYFLSPNDSLEEAQLSKKRHLAAKLYLNRSDLKILDIGSGWGGLGIYLASEAEADVTGITLSVEQHKISNERARHANLSSRVRFHMHNYREEMGRYDRIVSVGMFEHVGRRNYPDYFRKIRDLMSDDGVALVHSIGFFDQPGPINPFILKYIFPGAEIPTLSEVCSVVEQTGLVVTDIEILRLHYAETLRLWRERFLSNWNKVARLYDERFCRMWLFYLVLCEIGFRHRTMMVFQLQLTKRIDTLPITRGYITDWECAHEPNTRRKQAHTYLRAVGAPANKRP